MNKLVKGSIAGAAGIALLLGGAGTMAYWSSSQTVNAGVISAGHLSVTDPGAATDGWTSGGTAIDINDFHVSPGDEITYTKTLTVTAIGDNLEAELTIDPASITGVVSNAKDLALAQLLIDGAQPSISGTNGFTFNGSGYDIEAGPNGIQTDVTVTVKFVIPNGAEGAENAAMDGQVNLSNIKINLNQI